MSINSMTGFARIDGMLPDGASLAWEVRSVNGRGPVSYTHLTLPTIYSV